MKIDEPGASIPKLVIRFSKRDSSLILAGMDWIVGNYKLLTSGRRSRKSPELVRAQRFDPGVYSQQLMDCFIAVRSRILPLKDYGRLRFDSSFEIAACALAVRTAVKCHRHGHRPLKIRRIGPVSRRVLKRLEALRKRAKRAEVKQYGVEVCRQNSQNWARFLVWLRVYVTNCGCLPRRRSLPGRRRTANRSQLVSWTREELENRGDQVPDERELRRLVVVALRDVRTGHSTRDLLEDKKLASRELANFVTSSMEKAPKRRKS